MGSFLYIFMSNTARLEIYISDEKCLYYCEETKIVYIIFGECGGYDGYGYMSPYYAPNGLP